MKSPLNLFPHAHSPFFHPPRHHLPHDCHPPHDCQPHKFFEMKILEKLENVSRDEFLEKKKVTF
eukprot:TRINITY_DN16484_c0_g1_i1.p2 TRINITY_DN16484_c0_g1~~TRINITY_DN16484_c0_g1_i1.p2  ORF type:complete len:64 (-),score=12.61 TRINITY_DN16484_c0_g1_i1:116-307(-)